MKKGLIWTILLTAILGLMWTSSLSQANSTDSANAGNLERTYTFDVQNGHFTSTHTIHASIPTTLYEYYNSRNHVVSSDGDYARFATPSVFKSIAENIQKATNNTPYSDEQFANAVLTLVRQITYSKSSVKYPVEAIVENSGDCDVVSLLAASIMKAGGLDVVLFHYKGLNPSHMNIGVYLPYKPVYRSWWINPIGFEYNNKTYWVAEATPLGQWKVGERPQLTANSNAYIIPLNNSQKTSPGQISSSLDTPLLPSSISITLSSDSSNLTENTRPLTISGAISPALPNKTVTMYISQSKSIQIFKTNTDQSGNYLFNWNLTTTSTYKIQTSSTDISNFTGADSETLIVFGSYRPLITDYELEYNSVESAESAITRANMAGYGDFNQGVKDFLKSNVSGIGALLSGEFIVLDSNQTEKQNEPITMPKVEYIINSPSGRMPIRIIIEEKIILPPVIPNGQFGFILQQNSDNNYSASVRILQDQDVSQITSQLNEEDPAFMNASRITKENTWYKITATISEAATNVTLYEENGTPMNNVAPRNNVTADQIGVVLAFNPGEVIAFRNLKVETLEKPEPTASNAQSLENQTVPPETYIGIIAVLIVVVAAVAMVRRKRRKN